MSKKNCWEKMECGREPGGARTSWLGVCPTAMANECNNLNDGDKGGRICWALQGTFSDEDNGKCVFLGRYKSCSYCPFFNEVRKQQGEDFVLLKPGSKKTAAA
ncbi:MAG: two-CW domain-containing protein [Candidatus Zixiibacteriota bacterium]